MASRTSLLQISVQPEFVSLNSSFFVFCFFLFLKGQVVIWYDLVNKAGG